MKLLFLIKNKKMKAPKILKLIPVLLIMMFSIASFAQKPAKVDPGLKKYGNVAFADPLHHKYPIDTDKHIRSAWTSIHVKNHAAKYTPEELKAVHGRILDAATAHGIHFKIKD
jgi:hypothetical protein